MPADLKVKLNIIDDANKKLDGILKELRNKAEATPIEVKVELKDDGKHIKAQLKTIFTEFEKSMDSIDIGKKIGENIGKNVKNGIDNGMKDKGKDNFAKLEKQLSDNQTKLQNKIAAAKKYSNKYNNVNAAGFRSEFKKELGAAEDTVRRMTEMRQKISKAGDIGNLGDTDIKVLKSFNDEVEKSVSNLNRLTSQTKATTAKMDSQESLIMARDKMGSRLTDYEAKYGLQLRKNTVLYEKYLTLLNRVNSGQFKSLNEMNREFATFRTQARTSGVEIETFGTKLERTFGSRVRSAMAGQGVFLIQSAMRDIVTNAVEVDTAMTELKKVTTATDTEYAKFMDGASERAQRLGATLRDTVSATAD